MNDNELLQAILSKLDGLEKGQELLQQEVAGLTVGQETLQQNISSLKQGQESLQQQITKTNIILENDIDKKLSALFDGHALDTEMIKHIVETVDDIDAAMTAVDIVTKANIKEINKLKTKIG